MADAGEISVEELYEAEQDPKIIQWSGVQAVTQTVVSDGTIVAGGNIEARIVGKHRLPAPRIQGYLTSTAADPRQPGTLFRNTTRRMTRT